jgi:hypothetical protein
MSKQLTQSQTRPRSKAGRTLLVKPTTETFDKSIFETFPGYKSVYHTEKSNTYFVMYSTPQEALSALKGIKNKYVHDVRIKFSHYRVFFKIEGLTSSSDYNSVKALHTKLVSDKDCNVLYYRLYRKDNKFIGCGDFTVDTKEAFDSLMNADGLKNFSLDDTIKGVHYRYKKNENENEHDNEQFDSPKEQASVKQEEPKSAQKIVKPVKKYQQKNQQ